jgi:hypothetical protein
MDCIEGIFGISHDGGSGSLEFALFAIPLIGLYLLHRIRQSNRAPKR